MPPKAAAAAKRTGAKAEGAKASKKSKPEPEPEPEEEEEENSEDDEGDDEDETDQKPEVTKAAAKTKDTKPTPAKDSGASILRKNDKNNMAYPKGTYLIRLADFDTEKKDHIWRVDNHQLLQKYERQTPTDDSKYQRTNRYTGYFCSEGYKFLELRVLEKENKEEKVRVKYPTAGDLQTAKDKAEAKQRELEEAEE